MPPCLDRPQVGGAILSLRHMVSRGVHNMRHTTARVAADVGGTFTDIVLVDTQRGVTLRLSQRLPPRQRSGTRSGSSLANGN